ncbi:hypothetical protein HDU92_006647 [Lobulomyces angularis]|nr:hypothetical protein HDU92_006647 [Lobulomyces angularis]
MNVKISYLGYLNMNKSADSVDSRLILKTHKKKFLHLMNSMLDKILLAVNNFKENIDQKSLHKKEPEILPSPYYELKNQLKEMSENKIYSEQQYLSKYNEKLFNKQGDVINEDSLKKNPYRKRSVSFSDNDINESRISTTSQRTLGTSVSARGRNSDSYKRRGSVDERKNSLINSCGDAKQNNIQNQIDFYASRQNSLEKFKNFKFHYLTEDVTKENLLEGLKLEFTNVNMYLEWEPNLVLKKNMLDKKQNSRSFGESLNSVTILNLLKKLHLKETKNFTLTLRFKLFIDLKNFDLIFKFVENDALIHDEKFEEEFANLPLILDKVND